MYGVEETGAEDVHAGVVLRLLGYVVRVWVLNTGHDLRSGGLHIRKKQTNKQTAHLSIIRRVLPLERGDALCQIHIGHQVAFALVQVDGAVVQLSYWLYICGWVLVGFHAPTNAHTYTYSPPPGKNPPTNTYLVERLIGLHRLQHPPTPRFHHPVHLRTNRPDIDPRGGRAAIEGGAVRELEGGAEAGDVAEGREVREGSLEGGGVEGEGGGEVCCMCVWWCIGVCANECGGVCIYV